MFAADIRAQHHELLAAQAAEHIGATQPVADPFAHCLQYPVTDGVAMLVVDALEMVQVDP